MDCDQFLTHLDGVKPAGDDKWQACCPGHDDQRQSLSIAQGDDGGILVYCHAGCSTESVVDSIGLTLGDLMAPGETTLRSQIIAAYDYRDESGELLYQAVRMLPKDFRQRKPTPGGGWEWRVGDVRRVPYRLPELLAAPTSEVVFIPEGEKDVDNLRELGLVATCNVAGAGKWRKEYNVHLESRDVVLLPDNDQPGRKHAAQIAEQLVGVARSVKILSLPGLPAKGDVSDWLTLGGGAEELRQLSDAAPAIGDCGDFGDGSQEFETVVPLLIEPPPFPATTLPPVLGCFAQELSEATQTPLDLAGLLVLAVAATAIAKRVETAATSTWTEPANIYVLVGLDPANRKTAVFRQATSPLSEWEIWENERLAPDIRAYQQARRILDSRIRKLEERAAKEQDPVKRQRWTDDAANASQELATLKPVFAPRLTVDDATPERIVGIMEEQDGRLACMSPEGGIFQVMAGRYSNRSPNFDIFLKGHAGDDHRSDRISRPGEFIERPALTMALCVQLDVIQEVSSNKVFHGRGLTARFLYAIPKSTLGHRTIKPPPISESSKEAYRNLIQLLCSQVPAVDEDGKYRPWRLTLSEDADSLLTEFREWLEPKLAPGDELHDIQGWAGKLPGAIVRLASIMHAAECCNYLQWWLIPIKGDTMRRAIELGHYLLAHARVALAAMNFNAELSDARHVASWILRHKRSEFTKRDAYQAMKNRFEAADDLDRPLQMLERHNYIRRRRGESRKGPGRPASSTYETNPTLLANTDL